MTTPVSDSQAVDHAITSRMSARAFTNQQVPKALITEILQVASRAPSGTNTQPWKVYVLQGKSRDTLVEKVCAAHDAMRANPEVAQQYQEQYDYYRPHAVGQPIYRSSPRKRLELVRLARYWKRRQRQDAFAAPTQFQIL